MSRTASDSSSGLSAARFTRKFLGLILLAWTAPVFIGVWYLRFIGMFTAEQLRAVLSAPAKPVMNLALLAIALAYFARYAAPIKAWLAHPQTAAAEPALERMRRFPVHFWGLFLAFMLLAPSTMMLFAQLYAGYAAEPLDWFRIHLVALTVSILVGLPIFFLILDLFGRTLQAVTLRRPHVTLRTKVFLIGALVPLLVDTVLVQYYWAKTGHFGMDTFLVWLSLELIAIGGSLIFVRSFSQALQPLGTVLGGSAPIVPRTDALAPRSTDELGVLTSGYRDLLDRLRTHGELVQISNRLLRSTNIEASVGAVIDEIMALCRHVIGGDRILLVLHEPASDELVVVAQTGCSYRPEGYVRIGGGENSIAGWVFRQGKPAAIADTESDLRANPRLRRHFGARAAIAAPLCTEQGVTGVLLSIERVRRRKYSADELGIMEVFAREAALALQHRLLQQQRATAEAARLEQEQQFRLLLDSTAEAIFGADLTGTCTFVNPACVRMLGYTDESELLGKNMHILIHHTHADGRPYPKEECGVRLASLAGRSGHSDQEVHWRKDGSSFPVEWWSHPIYKEGQLIGTVVTFVDITGRKRAAEALRRLDEYNRLLLNSTSDGIFGVDPQLRCTFANRAAAEMLGFSVEQLHGRDMHALVQHSREDGSPLPREESLIYRAVHEDASFWSDTEVLWHRGTDAFPVQYSANPIHEQGRATGAVVVFRDVAEARAMARRMDYLATHDPLTGLVNRHEFERRLERALQSAHNGESHVLCYLDLDQFKVVNDSCGHVAGDELLRQLTGLLQSRIRHSDTLARLGGDEFGVLFEGCPLERAVQLAHDLWRTVQGFRFAWEDKTFSVGVSIGVTPIDRETAGVDQALGAADAACYMAKDNGRNRVHVFEPDDADLARRRGEMQWVARIRDALDHDRFELAYQPVVPIGPDRAGRAGLIEILVRMRGDNGESIPPGAFLPAAERYNLMRSIDAWVVRSTFERLAAHRARLEGIGLCAINLSGQSLGDASFLRYVIEQLETCGVPGERICFEVTETAAVANLTQAVRFMRELKAHGCLFALDDFGSGMSSFAYLKNLPVDLLKIDGHFVRELARDPVDRAMVEAINRVGHVMGLRTVAEFVEDREIFDALCALGVDYAQGYGIAPPASFDALLAGRQGELFGLDVPN